MISEKSFEEVIANLEKYKLKKTKLSKLKMEDMYVYPNNIFPKEKSTNLFHAEKLFLFNLPIEHYTYFCRYRYFDFENYDKKYLLQPPFKKYSEEINLENFDKDYDLYILKNEHFGFDSKKLNFLQKFRNSALKYPFFEIENVEGAKQTFILVKTEPTNSKAEFYFKYSDYCQMVYGETDITIDFIKSIGEFIKKIFGWPIINYRLFQDIDTHIKKYNLIDAEKTFNFFIEKNQLNEFEYAEIINNYSVNKKDYLKNENNPWKDFEYGNEYFPPFEEIKIGHKDFIKDISTIKMYFFNKSEIKDKNYIYYNFWSDDDLSYLKFFVLKEGFWENTKIKTEFDFNQDINLQNLAFEKNIIITKHIKWPILVWDQRSFLKPFYKFIVPRNLKKTLYKKSFNVFFQKLFNSIEEINEDFAPYWKKEK
ncbi:hypothetical protein ACW95P_03550 [Candidatus Mycoplasma pogonae]